MLAASWIFDRGRPEFPSKMPASYYNLLLKKKKTGSVPSDMTGKDYQVALLATEPEDQQALVSLLSALPKRTAGRRRSSIDDDIDGGVADVAISFDVPPAPAAIRDGSIYGSNNYNSNSGSASSSSSSSSNIDGDDLDAGPKWPQKLNGQRLAREVHKDTGDAGLRVKCPVHTNCRRFRSLKKLDHFGRMEPLYFLGAWMACATDLPVERHRKKSPTRAEIKRYIESDRA